MNNQADPMLTVITATRNVTSSIGIESLERCLRSVAELKIPHEHIIQDGLSTDDTLSQCHRLSSRNVRIYSESDTGIYSALNKALQKARGKWVYVLGADDYIKDASTLEDTLLYAAKDNVDVIASPVWTEEFYNKPAPVYHRLLFCGMVYPHQGIIMRKEVMLDVGGFDERYKVAADCNMLLGLILKGSRVKFISKPYTYYSSSGFSSGNKLIEVEYKRLLQEHLAITDAEAELLFRRRLLPLRVIIRYLLRKEPCIRKAIRFHIARYILSMLCCIDKSGRVIFR